MTIVPIDAPVFRLGLVGAGRMGRTHMRALDGNRSVRITAVAEPDEAIRASLSGRGCALHPSFGAMLAAGDLDGVLVAAPSDRHVEAIDIITTAGLPILCEKPCGVSASEAKVAASIAARRGIPLQVAYWRRFVPALRELKAGIESRSFGELLFAGCAQWDEAPPPPAFRQSSGGIFIDMGVHEFDQIRWLSGQEIMSVQAVAARLATGPQVSEDPESATAICALSGGGTALVSLGRRHAPGDMCRVELFGTRNASDLCFLDPQRGEAVFLDALRRQAAAFAGMVRGGSPDGASAQDAVAALLAAEQAGRACVA